MRVISLKPSRSAIIRQHLAETFLCAVSFLIPSLSWVSALLFPLLICVNNRSAFSPIAVLSIVCPTAASLMAGFPLPYSLSLLLPGSLTYLITRLLPFKKKFGWSGIMCYSAAYCVSVCGILVGTVLWVGKPVSIGLTNTIMALLTQSENGNQLLIKLVQSGILSVPSKYINNPLLSIFGRKELFNQLSLEFSRFLKQSFSSLLPKLSVQAALIGGLFTALRVQRSEGAFLLLQGGSSSGAKDAKTQVLLPPGFRLLTIPPKATPLLIGLLFTCFLFSSSTSSFGSYLFQILYAFLSCIFELLGSAVIVFALTFKNPEREWLAGMLSGLLFLVCPAVLAIIGIIDKLTHSRARFLKLQNNNAA